MGIFDPTQADGGGTTPPGQIPPGEPGSSQDPWSASELDAATQFYTAYIHDHHIESFGQPIDGVHAYQLARRNGMGHDQALTAALTQLGWDHPPSTTTPPPTPPPNTNNPPPTPPTTTVVRDPFPVTPAPTPPPSSTLPPFTPPTPGKPPPFAFPDFVGPTGRDVFADPSYQFRFGEGMRAVGASAAARGVSNTGDTLKDFLNYGQQAASQEYGNVWDRWAQTYGMNRSNALTTYNTNYQTQYSDPFTFASQNARDSYMPKLLGWQTDVQSAQHASDQKSYYDWAKYAFDNSMDLSNRQQTFDEWYKKLLLQWQVSQ